MNSDRVLAIYARELAREMATPGYVSSHASILAATRSHVHLELREEDEISMVEAWRRTDVAVREAGIWDEAPSPRDDVGESSK